MDRFLIAKDYNELLDNTQSNKSVLIPTIDEMWSSFISKYTSSLPHFIKDEVQINAVHKRGGIVVSLDEIKCDVILNCLYTCTFWKAQRMKPREIDEQHQQDIIQYGQCYNAYKSGKQALASYYIPVLPISLPYSKCNNSQSTRNNDPIYYLDFHIEEWFKFLDNKSVYFSPHKNEKESICENKSKKNSNRFFADKVLQLKYGKASDIDDCILFEHVTSYYLCSATSTALEKIKIANELKYHAILSVVEAEISLFRDLPFRYGRTTMLCDFIDELDCHYEDRSSEYYRWIANYTYNLQNEAIRVSYNNISSEFLSTLISEYNAHYAGVQCVDLLYKDLKEYISKDPFCKSVFNDYSLSSLDANKCAESKNRFALF